MLEAVESWNNDWGNLLERVLKRTFSWKSRRRKGVFSARFPRKRRIQSPKTDKFCETFAKIEDTLTGVFSARLRRKRKIQNEQIKFCETIAKIEDPDFQNERFLRDILENWRRSRLPKPTFSTRLSPKTKIRSSKTNKFCETSAKIEIRARDAPDLQNKDLPRDFRTKSISDLLRLRRKFMFCFKQRAGIKSRARLSVRYCRHKRNSCANLRSRNLATTNGTSKDTTPISWLSTL